MNKMSDATNKTDYDTYRISGQTYMKEVFLGNKAWKLIESKAPGRFVDIMEAKFTEKEFMQKIDVNK